MMDSRLNTTRYQTRKGTALAVLVVIMSLLGLVVVGTVRPLRDEATLTTMRVETVRAFYAAESGMMVVIQGYMGAAAMPIDGSEITINGQVVEFMQIPDIDGTAIIHGKSGHAIRRIELELE